MSDALPGATPVGAARKENIVQFVMKRQRHSADHHQAFFSRSRHYYDIYRGVTSRRYEQFRNNVHVPQALSIIQSDVARKALTSFAAWPVVTFVGYAPEDAQSAKRNEILVSAQLHDCDSFTKAVDFYTSADVYGTAICKLGWKQTVERCEYREQNPILGVEEIKRRDVTLFDGPDWEVVDLLDFFPQPGIKRIKDMAWCIYRYYLDLDEIERRAKLGAYDMRGVAELRVAGMSSKTHDEMKNRFSVYRSQQDYDARVAEYMAKPVEIMEYWGLVPNEMAPDGVINRVISVGNGTTLLRNYPTPFFKKDKPFFAYSPMPDMHYFHGIGKVEPIAKLNLAASRLASQRLDAEELALSPTILATSGSGLDKQNLYLKPGRVISVDGPVGDDQIRPLSFDLRGVSGSYAEIEQLWRWAQQATGIVEDTIMGGGAVSRETATSVSGRFESAATRLQLEAVLAERGWLEPMCDYIRALNQQFLKTPKIVNMLGSAATVNPYTGYPLPPEPVQITLEDVNRDYRARAEGATQMLSRSMRRQDSAALSQLLAMNPAMAQVVSWGAYAAWLMEIYDAPKQDLLISKPTELNVASQAMGGGGGGMSGMQPQMDPQMLNLMGG